MLLIRWCGVCDILMIDVDGGDSNDDGSLCTEESRRIKEKTNI